MANYDKETKFYWLQLKEDFFEDDAIQWLEEQEPNGRDYAYFYLKLCLKSLKSNGFLIRKVGNVLIPYDNKKLAELTKMDFDTVTVAMELLKQIGLVQILETGEIYVTQLENLIGSVSKGALKKQQQRELKNNQEMLLEWTKGGQMSTKDKDKDKDKTKDRDKDKNNIIAQNQNDLENDFEILWKLYPRKQGKSKALKSFIKARKKGVSIETITLGLQKYCDYVKKRNIETQFIPYGSTWFNQESWNDEYDFEEPNDNRRELHLL